jgi:hypothetical protein
MGDGVDSGGSQSYGGGQSVELGLQKKSAGLYKGTNGDLADKKRKPCY